MSEVYHVEQTIELDQFREFYNPGIVYFLGYLKGNLIIEDGSSRLKTDFYLKKEDLVNMRQFLTLIGIQEESIKKSQKNTNFSESPHLFQILENIRFFRSSYYNFENQIWKIIPNEKSNLFLRGLIDASGRYYNYKNGGKISIKLSKEYDWTFPQLILNQSLEVSNYTMVKKVVNEIEKDLLIQIIQERSRKIIGSFIYGNFLSNPIGLVSNYRKWESMLKHL